MKAASVVGIGLGFSTLNRPPVHCDGEFKIGCYRNSKLYQFPRVDTQNEGLQPSLYTG